MYAYFALQSQTRKRKPFPKLPVRHIPVYGNDPCAHRDYGYGSTVCVCNVTYCNTLAPIARTGPGVVTVYESSKQGDRFLESQLKFGHYQHTGAAKAQTITVDRSKGRYQKIVGFGGAFTDSTGLNIKSLPEKLQKQLIGDYYSGTGIEYNLGRVPIASSDFSTHGYSYDDKSVGDFEFKHFALTAEDFDYKIPYLKLAKEANKNANFFGSPWSPPAWLKNNSQLNHGGYLIGNPGGQHYKAFAHYLVKFLDAYKAQGVPMWGITIENEPGAGKHPDWANPSLGFTAQQQRDFIKLDLGPIMEGAGYGANTTQLMMFDDGRNEIQDWARTILGDREAARYVAGVAFHWYANTVDNIVNLDTAHGVDPSKFLLATEACEEWRGQDKHVHLGSWDAFERYANDIIRDLNHWTGGWVDWNLALDTRGGPNWVNNFVDAPIIINATGHEYYKQPIYYAMGHYSKFLAPGSQRVYNSLGTSVDKFEATVFERPDGGTVVIVLNLSGDAIDVTINDVQNKGKVTHLLKPHSIQTYVYYKN
ncbi:unnamed protein product [Oppiella nova]|uniref:Glucosylceramidase n=1 Tax=Oppiella nova TaxID=334625 RepID=A0A7R9M536_9ACAR|nr:unnamed protein product [Oppiella nova]CAG2170912.1 unnamed protein product [Oppiella nova]